MKTTIFYIILLYYISISITYADSINMNQCSINNNNTQIDKISKKLNEISRNKKLNEELINELYYYQHQKNTIQLIDFIIDIEADFQKDPNLTIKKINNNDYKLNIEKKFYDYIVSKFYLSKGSQLFNNEYINIGYQYLKKSAINGYNNAIIDWTEYKLTQNAESDEDIKECVELLKSIKSDDNLQVDILLARITILYQYQNLTGIEIEKALDIIYHHRKHISLTNQYPLWNELAEAGIAYIVNPNIKDGHQKGIELLKEFVASSYNLDIMMRIIYVYQTMDSELNSLSEYCVQRINEIISSEYGTIHVPGYIKKMGWDNKNIFDELNSGANFIEICIKKLNEKFKNNKCIKDIFSIRELMK